MRKIKFIGLFSTTLIPIIPLVISSCSTASNEITVTLPSAYKTQTAILGTATFQFFFSANPDNLDVTATISNDQLIFTDTKTQTQNFKVDISSHSIRPTISFLYFSSVAQTQKFNMSFKFLENGIEKTVEVKDLTLKKENDPAPLPEPTSFKLAQPGVAIIGTTVKCQIEEITPTSADRAVKWYVTDLSGNPTDLATIDNVGTLTPKAQGTVKVKAVSQRNENVFDQVDVIIVQPAPLSLEISGPKTIQPNGHGQYIVSPTPEYASKDVIWSISGQSLGSNIDAGGYFTAGSQTGTVTILATSKLDTKITAIYQIEITQEGK